MNAAREKSKGDFTRDFRIEDCTFATTGHSPFFPLVPGQVAVYRGEADGEPAELTITTTDLTVDIGGVLTRVVEERQLENDELVEVSRNFFAHCTENNTVFYFGEETDIYENGEIVGHEGSWQAGTAGAKAGVIVPGMPMLGARYFQEIAPGVAMDRGEVIQVGVAAATPYGSFSGVLVTEETTPLEPGAREFKRYAPEIGLIQDAELKLTTFTTP